MKITPARVAAYEILRRIESERAFSSVLLPEYEADLSDADRGLCHELVLGTLRRELYLDKLIVEFAGGRKLDLAVRIALRIGIYQLLFLDKIPAYSAINESVNLVQRAKKTSAKAFVNAILRRASQGVPSIEFTSDVERISIETSHPAWLIERWSAEFGAAAAEQIAASNNVQPPIAFRFTIDGSTVEKARYKPSDIAEGAFTAASFDQTLRGLADSGSVYFQDEASQLVAEVVATNVGDRFLDVCAAPGGKTTLIASRSDDRAMIVAGDLNAARVETLAQTTARFGRRPISLLRYDAEQAMPFADGSFDTVLVDAPCSGTGTIRHNPEIRYFLDPEDFAQLAKKQRAILANASKLVSPGGRLIYSTCSLERDENEEVCREFLAAFEDFTVGNPTVPDRSQTDEGFARTFPYRDNTDGFFIAEFRRA